jgi:diguanylate cyclase (GGDEF)-like protein/PAS domain S-box-containing protein
MLLSQLLKSSRGKSKAELRLVLNAVVDGLCGLDAGGNVTFCNDALLKMTGYRREEIIGNNLHELLHHSRPDGTKYPAEECAVRSALNAHQAIHIAGEVFWRKDGTSFPTEYWSRFLQQPVSLTECVATIHDITDLKQSEEVLRLSEEKFRRILASVPDVAWTSDQHGQTMYIGPRAEAIFGYTSQEICAASANFWLDHVHPEDFVRVKQAYGALFEKQGAFDEEYRIRRKDEAWIWVHGRATGSREKNGVLYADGILSDITRRKQAEGELQSKTAFLEAQANSTSDGIMVRDGHGRRILQNQRYVELFKIPPEMLLIKDDRQMLEYVATLVKYPESFLAKVYHLHEHTSEISRDEIEFKDGMILDRYSAPVVGKNGIYYGRIWTFRDITERKRNEDALQQLSMAVEQSPVSVMITDPQGNISYVNRKFTECSGYGLEEVAGRNPRILNSGLNSPDLHQNLWSTITQGHEWRGEFCNKKKNGDIYWEAATISPITNPGGAIVHFLAVKEDITERKRVEEELYRAHHMLQTILDTIPQRVFWKDRNCTYLGCNRILATDAGLNNPAEIIGKNDFDLAWSETAEVYRADDKLVMEQGSAKLGYEEIQDRPGGGQMWLRTSKLPLWDREGKVIGVLGTYEDITERKLAEERVQFLAYYDALTGLPNRVLLRDRLSQALAAARRQGNKVALLFLDLDRFKIINDSLGHSVGDLLLQEVGERLKRCVREQDTVARLGGDEFLIVLTNVKDIPDAAVAGERFMDAMTPGFAIQGHALNISCSLGISIFPEHGGDSETLIKNADAAMYSAKDGGRNNFQFFTADMNAQAVERLALENGLRLALEKKELFLVYQPQMDIASGKITGLEALLRWQHPELGLVPPDKFIRIAENSGLIMPIGEWVLRTACVQARKWQDEGLTATSVAVNVSAVQFRQEGFPKTIRRVLDETGLAPQYLELELTESLLLSNADVMFSVLQQLTTMGLRLAIDDFGTGYSSLSYLKQFPVSKLKIDRSFIRDLAVNPDDAAITTAIISMAKSLNLKVIAEGVENEAQMAFLRAHQCDEIQGYYFSKPLTADKVAAKLRAHDSAAHVRTQASGRQS